MGDAFQPSAQRPALLDFVEALGCRLSALRRDECGDWAIFGKFGHIYAVPGSLDRPKTPGLQIVVIGWSANGWNRAKRALAFASLTNNGDDEGALFIDRLPTPAEAEIIRHYVGVAKKAEFSDEVLARKREQALKARRQIGQKPASDDRAGVIAPAGA
jgi:hypothetical protein